MYFATDLTWNQTFVFAYTAFGGIIMGLIYCFNEAVKPYLKTKFMKNWYDVSFCIVSLLIMGIVLYSVNRGIVKLHTVAGFIFGYYIGFYTFKLMVKKTIDKTVLGVKKIKNALRKLLK